MADITEIRRGLAALLRLALPANEGHVYPWLQDNPLPPTLCVAGIQADGLTIVTFGGDDNPPGIEADFVIEAWLGNASDVGAQRFLDDLLSTDAVASSLESDGNGSGALYSRLLDTGVVLTGQTAAADSVAVTGYLGQTRLARPTGQEVLLAQWVVKVLA